MRFGGKGVQATAPLSLTIPRNACILSLLLESLQHNRDISSFLVFLSVSGIASWPGSVALCHSTIAVGQVNRIIRNTTEKVL